MLSLHTSPLAPLGGREAGGMNVYVREVAAGLARLGVAVDVFTRRADPATPEVQSIAEGAAVARLVQIDAGPAERIEKEEMIALTDAFAAGVEAFRAREGLRYDLVHSHYWLSVVAGESLARRWDALHAGMFHTLGDIKLRARAAGSEPAQRLEAERRLVHTLDRVVAATEHERRLLRQMYRVPPERVAVIPLGVDRERFAARDRHEARDALGIDPDERVLLAVGRIEPLKGLDILVRALAALTDRSKVVLYVIGGDDRAAAEIERLRALAVEAGVADLVRFLGPRPHEELAAYYNAADIVVVPSFYESFGLVAVEAMASGVPVIASRVGGLASTVADGQTGYLVPWRCPEPFAEKIELLLRNEPLRASLGAAGAERMRDYSWRAVSAQVRDLYAALLAERAAAGASTAAVV